MMTGIIPCLYNSFSFTPANLAESGNIICYDVKSDAKEDTSTQSHHIDCNHVLPEPMFIKKTPDTESSESEHSSKNDTDTDTDTEYSVPVIEPDITAAAAAATMSFHPTDMSKYVYSGPKTNQHTDSLLWSLYIMLYGVEKLEMIDNYYIESNRFKFELIELLRMNKPILKANKLKINALEDSLIHKPFITLETVHAVVVCKALSITIVQDRKYYDVTGCGGDGATYIIEKIKGKYVLYDAPQPVVMKYSTYIRDNYWRMESISAPIRPISAYKLQDLIDISTKLGLAVMSVIPGKFGSIGTEKRKTKSELYESICRYV